MSSCLIEKLPFHTLHPFTFVFSFIIFTIFLYIWLASFTTKCKTKLNLPPKPPKLPIIGNLHQLGKLPHRSLRSLSHKYGELMLMDLGNKPTLVVSSATAAEHIMKTHDLIFSNRPRLRFTDRVTYDGNDVAFSSYGENWRKMKAICVTKLLNSKRVQSFQRIRQEEVSLLIERIKEYDGSVINLSKVLTVLFKDLISRTALGRKLDDDKDDEFYKMLKEVMKVLGNVSVGDYVPFLGWIDKLTGLEGRAENVRKRFNEFVEEVIQEHQFRKNSAQVCNGDDEKEANFKDLVDVLLEIQQEKPEELSTQSMKAIILDMFIAGTETSSTTLEWAMTELIRHPSIMKKLQEEVRSMVKPNTRVVEDDLKKMKYLKAVINETLRLHPPAPLLIFRESFQNVKINRYDIDAKTRVIINAFAIQLDPEYWQDPEDFTPERFLNNGSSIDFKGQHFQFIPFGAGRRGCPGITYSIVGVELVLASLVYEFNWELPNGRAGETLDVEESSGITAGRQNPLMVIAT